MIIQVKQMKEFGSKRWGVYVNGVLNEGGFFAKQAAENCAEELRKLWAGITARRIVQNEGVR